MLKRLTRALVVLAAVSAAVPLPSLALGLTAADDPVICGCGCGREVGSCCCSAPRSTELAMRCTSQPDEADTPSVLRPPAVTRDSLPCPEPSTGRRFESDRPARRYAVDLEPDPPIPEGRSAR